jgi:hypothetical protein
MSTSLFTVQLDGEFVHFGVVLDRIYHLTRTDEHMEQVGMLPQDSPKT